MDEIVDSSDSGIKNRVLGTGVVFHFSPINIYYLC